jgi:hypothetical protein
MDISRDGASYHKTDVRFNRISVLKAGNLNGKRICRVLMLPVDKGGGK